MNTGPMRLYAPAFETLLRPFEPERAAFAAVLLSARYVPDFSAHRQYAYIAEHEIAGGTYRSQAVNAVRIEGMDGGAVLTSDPVLWAAPSDLMPARYMAFVLGHASRLRPTDALFGLLDLAPTGGAVEAQRGSLRISPDPVNGWFALTTDSNPQ